MYTTKKLMTLVGVLAVMLVGATPASSQPEEISVTGVIERFEAEAGPPCFAPATHTLAVEGRSGARPGLISDVVDLDAYVGQRVTVYGEPLINPAVGGIERCPDLIASRIEPAAPDSPTPDGGRGGTETTGGTTPPGSGSGSSSGKASGGRIKELPRTGGLPALGLAAGTLLLAGGLIVRGIAR